MESLTKENLSKKIYGLEHYKPGMWNIRDISIRITSGTTGAPSLVVMRRANSVSKKKLVVDHCRRLLAFVNKRASYVKWANDFLRPIAGQKPLEILLAVDMDEARSGRIDKLIHELPPDGIYSIPTSYVLESMRYVGEEARKTLEKNIRRVVVGGEMIPHVEQELLRRCFPLAEFRDLYGSAEVDLFSASCPFLSRRYSGSPWSTFHPFDEDYTLDIEEPDEEGFGEVLVSSFELPRYRLGDIGAIKDEVCECGMRRTLLVAGRKDFDRIGVFGLVFLSKLLIERMEAFSDFLDDYLLEVGAGESSTGERRGSVSLFVVPKVPPLHPLIHERLLSAIHGLPVSKTRVLGSFVKEGLFAKPLVREVKTIERPGMKRFHLRRTFT